MTSTDSKSSQQHTVSSNKSLSARIGFLITVICIILVNAIFSSPLRSYSNLVTEETQGKFDFADVDSLEETSSAPPVPITHSSTIRQGNIKTSQVRDATLRWDSSVPRLWFPPYYNEKNKPPAMILLTSYGWNQVNQKKALQIGRSYRDTFFMEGVINHPWFHPTAWEDITLGNATIDPDVRYYVVLDRSTCRDTLWPFYGEKPTDDLRHGRPAMNGHSLTCHKVFCAEKHAILSSRLFRDESSKNGNNAFLLDFECAGDGPSAHYLAEHYEHYPRHLFVSLSANIRDLNHSMDQGLQVGACNPTELGAERESAIDNYADEDNRSFFFVYLGNFRAGRVSKNFGARGTLAKFNNNKTVFVLRHFREEFGQSAIANWTYQETLSNTVFGAVPRGDNKFSYRFAEVLSAGCIPVVYADDWLWPLRPELVDWSECAVAIEENAANHTMNILNRITKEQRSRMRKKCYEIYRKYFQNETGVIDGIVQGLEEVVSQRRFKPPFGFRCIEGKDDPTKDCNWA